MTNAADNTQASIDGYLDRLNIIKHRIMRIKRKAFYFKLLADKTSREELHHLAMCGQTLNIILHSLEQRKRECVNALRQLAAPARSSAASKTARVQPAATRTGPLTETQPFASAWKGALIRANHSQAVIDNVANTPELIPLSYLEQMVHKYAADI